MNYLVGFAFGKQSRSRGTVQSTDYKKFNVETDSQFTLPARSDNRTITRVICVTHPKPRVQSLKPTLIGSSALPS